MRVALGAVHQLAPPPMVRRRRISLGDAAAQCASNGGTWNGSVCLANSPGVNPASSPPMRPVDFSNPTAVVQAVLAGNPQALAAQAAYNKAALANPASASTAAALQAQGWDPYLSFLQTTGSQSGGDYNISPTGEITPVVNPLSLVSAPTPATPQPTPATPATVTPPSMPASVPLTSGSGVTQQQLTGPSTGATGGGTSQQTGSGTSFLTATAVDSVPNWLLIVAALGIVFFMVKKK